MNNNQRLARKAMIHLEHMINISKNDEDLMFRLSGFYGTLVEVLKENKD